MSLDMSWDISVSSTPCTSPSPPSPAPPSPSPRVASRDPRPAVSSAYNQLVGEGANAEGRCTLIVSSLSFNFPIACFTAVWNVSPAIVESEAGAFPLLGPGTPDIPSKLDAGSASKSSTSNFSQAFRNSSGSGRAAVELELPLASVA